MADNQKYILHYGGYNNHTESNEEGEESFS